MSKKIPLFSLLIVGLLILAGCGQKTADQNLMSKTRIGAEKIEVVHFHATQQCWSCITVGEYALKTIKEKFSEEYKSGKIVFKDINSELPANQAIVIKYQASASSLFINAIKDGKDNIEEDVNVWRYVSNESQFIGYFENKIKSLL
jgi:ABC-type glycerol-3-phosphate transport system substrate-binding protein